MSIGESLLGKHASMKCFAGKKHTDMVKLLVNHGIDVDKKDNSNNTPLFMAVDKCEGEIAACLLKNGAVGTSPSEYCLCCQRQYSR